MPWLNFPGKVFASTHNEIILKNVPIVTPNCDVVCPSLSVNLKPGQHLLITGKIFQILGKSCDAFLSIHWFFNIF